MDLSHITTLSVNHMPSERFVSYMFYSNWNWTSNEPFPTYKQSNVRDYRHNPEGFLLESYFNA